MGCMAYGGCTNCDINSVHNLASWFQFVCLLVFCDNYQFMELYMDTILAHLQLDRIRKTRQGAEMSGIKKEAGYDDRFDGSGYNDNPTIIPPPDPPGSNYRPDVKRPEPSGLQKVELPAFTTSYCIPPGQESFIELTAHYDQDGDTIIVKFYDMSVNGDYDSRFKSDSPHLQELTEEAIRDAIQTSSDMDDSRI